MNNTNTSKGTFHILRIQDEKLLENKPGLKIFGVRFAKFLPNGWVHRNGCTPQQKLLSFCKDLEKEQIYQPEKYPGVKISEEAHQYLINKPVWDEFVFKKIYLPNYLDSLNNTKASKELEEITSTLENGQDVYYACYCSDTKKCHRRIIAGIIQKEGFNIKSISN